MRKLFDFAKKKIVEFFSWIWRECRDWRTFILLVIVCLVVGLPVWGGYLLWFLTGWTWAVACATALLAFWWLPGAPYFAVCVAITLAIKRLFQKRRKKKAEPVSDEFAENTDGEAKASEN